MATTVRIVKQPDVTDLGGEKVMIDFDTDKYYMLKGAANYIWDIMADGITYEEICDKLLQEYDVSREVCEAEVRTFLEQMESFGFFKLEK